MASLRFLFAPPALFCFLSACSIQPEDLSNSASAQTGTGEGGSAGSVALSNLAGAKNGARAGAAGRTEVQDPDPDNKDVDPPGEDTEPANTGNTGNTGSAGAPAEEEDLPESCELNNTCASKNEDTIVTCGVVSSGHACEFDGFSGATASIAGGQRVVVGTACCGGCGCIPVELYFDGKHCWQGIPQCSLGNFENQVFTPHPTTTPNPSFVPPNSFYLGSGGIGGNSGAGGAAGLGFGGGPEGTGGVASAGSDSGTGNAGGGSGNGDSGAAPVTAGASSAPEAG